MSRLIVYLTVFTVPALNVVVYFLLFLEPEYSTLDKVGFLIVAGVSAICAGFFLTISLDGIKEEIKKLKGRVK